MENAEPDINGAPLYVPSFQDNIRMGSFVHVRNTKFGKPFMTIEKNNPASVARLMRVEKENPTRVVVLLFATMFHGPSGRPPKNHPPLPTHRFPRIVDGIGVENKELYQTQYEMTVPVDDIVQIAFCEVISEHAVAFTLLRFVSLPKDSVYFGPILPKNL